VLVEPDYKGFRIVVTPVRTEGAGWNAEIRVTRLSSEEEPYAEVVMCRRLSRQMAEERGLAHALRWVDCQTDR
jgi:hypothetical protein